MGKNKRYLDDYTGDVKSIRKSHKKFRLLIGALCVTGVVAAGSATYVLMNPAQTMTKEGIDEMDPNEDFIVAETDLLLEDAFYEEDLREEEENLDAVPLIEEADEDEKAPADAMPVEDQTDASQEAVLPGGAAPEAGALVADLEETESEIPETELAEADGTAAEESEAAAETAAPEEEAAEIIGTSETEVGETITEVIPEPALIGQADKAHPIRTVPGREHAVLAGLAVFGQAADGSVYKVDQVQIAVIIVDRSGIFAAGTPFVADDAAGFGLIPGYGGAGAQDAAQLQLRFPVNPDYPGHGVTVVLPGKQVNHPRKPPQRIADTSGVLVLHGHLRPVDGGDAIPRRGYGNRGQGRVLPEKCGSIAAGDRFQGAEPVIGICRRRLEKFQSLTRHGLICRSRSKQSGEQH